MSMKRVSFKVAITIKEAGYPQNINNHPFYNEKGEIIGGDYNFWKRSNKFNLFSIAPTYLDVWLWLWREMKIYIKDTFDGTIWIMWKNQIKLNYIEVETNDPEEAIIAAIEHLVDNDLIK